MLKEKSEWVMSEWQRKWDNSKKECVRKWGGVFSRQLVVDWAWQPVSLPAEIRNQGEWVEC